MNQNMFTLLTKIMPDNKILAIYKVGSSIFGLSDDESDKDYIVIVDRFDGTNVIKEENCDFFVIGDSYFEKLCKFDDRVMSYFAIWMDNALLASENLEYIDEGYQERFNALININWKTCFKKWLGRIIDYFRIRLDDIDNSKPLYHLFRIRALVEHYIKTSKFEYYFPEKDRELALKFKKNPRNYLKELNEVFSYLEEVYKEEEL